MPVVKIFAFPFAASTPPDWAKVPAVADEPMIPATPVPEPIVRLPPVAIVPALCDSDPSVTFPTLSNVPPISVSSDPTAMVPLEPI